MMGPVFRCAAAGSGGCRIETGKPLVRRASFSLHIGVAKDTLFMMIQSWDQSKNEATIISQERHQAELLFASASAVVRGALSYPIYSP